VLVVGDWSVAVTRVGHSGWWLVTGQWWSLVLVVTGQHMIVLFVTLVSFVELLFIMTCDFINSYLVIK